MGRDDDQGVSEFKITQRQLLDWLFTGGVVAVLAGLAWAWPPLGLIALGVVAMVIALRGARS